MTGSTASADFPVTPGAFQTTGPINNGVISPTYAFVTEISPNGDSMVFSTSLARRLQTVTAAASVSVRLELPARTRSR